MNAQTRQAILAAAHYQLQGSPVELSDRSFWRVHGDPNVRERRDILARANALVDASSAAVLNQFEGDLPGLFSGTPWPVGDGLGGPADTPTASIWVKFEFQDKKGNLTYRTFSVDMPWQSTLDEVLAEIDDGLGEFEDFYGLSSGVVLYETLLIA